MKRRLFIHGMAVGAVLGSSQLTAASTGLLPTIPQSRGPFYPVVPIPVTDSLIQGDHLGDALTVSGQLLQLDGAPIANARIDIWQCDARGVYQHPRAPQGNGMDPGFRGFATINTDADGGYRFETIMPVAYFGRPPHIHLMVHVNGRRQLTTQLYIRGEGGPLSLQLDPQTLSSGAYAANFNLVLNQL